MATLTIFMPGLCVSDVLAFTVEAQEDGEAHKKTLMVGLTKEELNVRDLVQSAGVAPGAHATDIMCVHVFSSRAELDSIMRGLDNDSRVSWCYFDWQPSVDDSMRYEPTPGKRLYQCIGCKIIAIADEREDAKGTCVGCGATTRMIPVE